MEAKNLAGMMNRRPGAGSVPMQGIRPTKTLGSSNAAPVNRVQPVSKTPAIGQQLGTQTVQGGVDSAVNSLVNEIKEMAGGFAVLSDKVIRENVALALNPEVPVEERTISLIQLDALASHIATMMMGLVFEPKFRQAFVDALNMEIKLDEETSEDRAKIRVGFNLGNNYAKSGALTFGVTELTPSAHAALEEKAKASFASMDAFQKEFDAAAANLAMETRVELGFIFSNFMYLMRAFSHNEVFFSYVMSVVEKVEASMQAAKA